MAVSAHAVAAELRSRLPSIGDLKLHKLLYYAQGHHAAIFGQPLFREGVSAWDNGPVVGRLWHDEAHGVVPAVVDELGEAELNTVAYVVSRYGRLTGRDLVNLTHAETPWREADARRSPGGSVNIPLESLRDFFRAAVRDDEQAPLDDDLVAALVAGAAARRSEPAQVDSLDEIRRRIRALSG